MGKKTGKQLSGSEVISKAREAFRVGCIRVTPHFQESCEKRKLSLQMTVEALEAKVARVERNRTQFREGLGWKYRITSEFAGYSFAVVVAFDSEQELILITAFFPESPDGVAPDELSEEA